MGKSLTLFPLSPFHHPSPLLEVGAASAVLLVPSGGSAPGPLALGAAKSVAGHTEPAAGALGLIQLALELGQLSRAPLHHMARPSAHMVSTLLAGGAGGRAISVARQCAFLESGAANFAQAGGVSR